LGLSRKIFLNTHTPIKITIATKAAFVDNIKDGVIFGVTNLFKYTTLT